MTEVAMTVRRFFKRDWGGNSETAFEVDVAGSVANARRKETAVKDQCENHQRKTGEIYLLHWVT
jgi:hypothetical protein